MKRILLLSTVLLWAFGTAWAQQVVSGKVTSGEDGTTLPGVAIQIKGTSTGVTSNIDGEYTLEVPSNETILVYSFYGYADQEQKVGNRTTINVIMSIEDEILDAVVVTAFGVQKDEKAIGYAVQEVSGEEFTEARETNIVNSLSGRIAGAQVTNSSGAVGSSSRIVLRGASSLTGNNQPLFVVDGVPISNATTGNAGSGGGNDYGNGASDINPDDIASITVLKGPNAAALYGSRGANGVILITTKSGKATKGLGVSVNSTATMEEPMLLPSFQNSYGQGSSNDFFEYVNGADGSGGVDESWGMPLDIGLEAVQWNSDGTPAAWVSKPNNINEFFEKGTTYSNNVAISGSNDLANFRLSLSRVDQKGILPNTDLSRNTISTSAGIDLMDKLRADATVNYVMTNSDNRPTVGYNAANPIQQFIWSGRNVDFAALKDYENLPIIDANCESCLGAGIAPINWNTRYQNNPFWSANNVLALQDKDRLFGNIRLNYQINDWLSAFVRTGTDFWTEDQKRQNSFGVDSYPYGFFAKTVRTFTENNSDFLISANKDFGTDWSTSLAFGGNRMDQNYQWIYGEAPQLQVAGVYNLDNVRSGTNLVTDNYLERKRINSLYGTSQIAYKNFLFLDLTGRNDWSSTLPAENNSYFYPSATVSAVISDMFEFGGNMLPYLKIRGSWAKVGNDTDPYQLIQTVTFRDPFGTVIEGTEDNSLLNPILKPEQTVSTEIGLDARVLNGRVGFDVTYYNKNTTDIIVPVQISASTGYTQRLSNVGEMSNKGVELQVTGQVIRNADFTWETGLNFARNRNEVVSLGEGLESLTLGGHWGVSIQARPGLPYGVIFGRDYVRDPEGAIVHENGLPQINTTDQIIGNTTPDFTAGFFNEFKYKGLKLNVLIDGRKGGDVHSMTVGWGRYAGVLSETLIGRETGIVGNGVKMLEDADGNVTYVTNDIVVPAKSYNQTAFSNSVHAGSVFDGSFIKLRQIQLGYSLPNKFLTNAPIKDINISIVGRNLGFLYKTAPHIDPETSFNSGNAQGLEFGQIPTTRSYGLNLSFKL